MIGDDFIFANLVYLAFLDSEGIRRPAGDKSNVYMASDYDENGE